MNRKEIDAMTDEELCVKADELLHPGNRINFFCDKLARFYPSDYEEYDWVPDYLNSIEDAWELTSKVPGCGWSVYELDEGGWAAVVMGKIEPLNGQTLWDVVAESGPDTAPRAITKAFIMAMENE